MIVYSKSADFNNAAIGTRATFSQRKAVSAPGSTT